MAPSFADLRLITSASSCAQNGGWSYSDQSCDPWGRLFNYPNLWVDIFSTIGIGESQTALIGRVQIILLVAAIFWWLYFILNFAWSRGKFSALFVIALLFSVSPPVLLLAERGNIDIWIFLGLSLVSVLLLRGGYYVPVAILGLLVALKIYPFASFGTLLRFRYSHKRLIFLLLTISLVVISLFSEWQIVLNRSISTWNSISYGSSVIPLISLQIFGIDESKSLATILGWSIFSLSCLTIKLLYPKQLNQFGRALSLNSQLLLMVQVFGSAYLFSYLVGTSYDLRLIFLLPIFLSLATLIEHRRYLSCLIATLIAVMYGGQVTAGFGKGGLLVNIVGDVALSFFSSFLFLLIWQSLIVRIRFLAPNQRR